MGAVGVAAAAVGLFGLLGSAHLATGTSPPPRAIASCSEAIYTTSANAPPRPVQAIRIGPAVFNSLAGLNSQRGISKPSKSNPFYSVKSPLTILARAGETVTVTIVREQKNAAVVYDRRETKRALNTQYAGGFLLRRLGCITIQVRSLGEGRTYRAEVPIGVAGC